MPFRVNNDSVAISAARSTEISQRQIEHSLTALASGSRIVRAGDDPAGFAIANSLKSQLAGTKQAKSNAEMASGLIQTAEGGLNEQNNILIRMRELAVQAASDTVGEDERGYINNEFGQLGQEFDRIAKVTRYGDKSLLTGNGQEFEFQVGAFKGPENVVKFTLNADTTGASAGLSGLDVSDRDSALDSIDGLDGAMKKVAGARAMFGAAQSQLQHTTDNLSVQSENIAGAVGRIVDVDVAEETAKLSQGQILEEAGTAVMAQANASAGRMLKLIG